MTSTRLVMAALLLLIVGMRLVHLEADPPESLSTSRAIYNDGGTYALNARQRLLQGSWIAPGDNVLAQSPGYTAIAFLAFRAGGLGLAPLRLLSVIGTLVATILVVWLTGRRWGTPTGLLVVLLLGADYLFVMYGRLELIEGVLVGVGAAAIAAAYYAGIDGDSHTAADRPCSQKAIGHDRLVRCGAAAIAAVLLVVGFLIKPTASVLVVPIVIYLAWTSRRTNDRRPMRSSAGDLPLSGDSWPGWFFTPLTIFVLVLLALLAVYYLAYYEPHATLFARFREAFRQNASGLWDLRPMVVWLQTMSVPGIWGIRGIPMVCLAIAGLQAVREDRDRWGVLLALWFLTGIAYLAPQSYRPNRFTLLFLPPAAALAVRGAQWLWSRRRPVNGAAGAGWLLYTLAAAIVHIRYPPGRNLATCAGLTLLAAILMTCSVLAGRRRACSVPARGAAAVLILLALAADVIPYFLWLSHPRTSLQQAGTRLGRLLDGAACAGDNWCEALALMHRAPVYKIDWLAVSEREMHTLRVKYVVYDASETRMPQLYGQLLRRGELIARLRVGHYGIKVVRLRDPGHPGKQSESGSLNQPRPGKHRRAFLTASSAHNG